MSRFIIYNEAGNILRFGLCPEEAVEAQAGEGEFVMEGVANDITQKVVDGLIVDKTPQEIIDDNPPKPEIPYEQQRAFITNWQLQDILNRLEQLEK